MDRHLSSSSVLFLRREWSQVAATPTTATIPDETIDFRETRQFSRLTNILFKVGLCPAIIRPEEYPLVLGYNLRSLFTCNGTPSEETCVSDDFRCDETTLPQRVGAHSAQAKGGGAAAAPTLLT